MPRKIRCTVESVVDHGNRVYTVDLRPDVPVPAFRAGQFLHLTVDPYDPSGFWPDSRVFSIASSPRDRGRVRVCYSVKGRYTTKMEHTLRPGGSVWIKLPYGEFVIGDAEDVVLLAGGTGISAFTAFLEALPPETTRRVWLAYGVRDPSLFLFREMIQSQLARVPAFQAIWFAETGAAPSMRAGRISLDVLFEQPEAAARVANAVFYLSGPPVMLKTLAAGLSARGVSAGRIRTDAWE